MVCELDLLAGKNGVAAYPPLLLQTRLSIFPIQKELTMRAHSDSIINHTPPCCMTEEPDSVQIEVNMRLLLTHGFECELLIGYLRAATISMTKCGRAERIDCEQVALRKIFRISPERSPMRSLIRRS